MDNTVLAVSAPVSYKDAGYQHAAADDSASGIARWLIGQVAGFPAETLPADVVDGLKEGYAMRFHETNKTLKGDTVYAQVNGQWIREADLPKGAKPTDSVRLNLHVALGYSNHEFGRLHETRDPQYKAIIKQYRDAFSSYASQKLLRLTAAAKKIKADESGEKRTRTNKEFSVWLKETLETADKRMRTAVSNKNNTDADLKRLREAVAAFNKVWQA